MPIDVLPPLITADAIASMTNAQLHAALGQFEVILRSVGVDVIDAIEPPAAERGDLMATIRRRRKEAL